MRSLILDGDLRPGMGLPPEATLAKGLGVSRHSMREALRILLGEGLVEIRRGDGVYIRKPSSADCIHPGVLQLLLGSEELSEVQEIRRILEPEIAAAAAQRASEESLEQVETVLRQMEEVASRGESIFELAWDFHRAIATAAGNRAMTTLITVVYRMIRVAERPLHDEYFDARQEVRDHRQLLAAIRSRDPAAARISMKSQLDSVNERLADGLQKRANRMRPQG